MSDFEVIPSNELSEKVDHAHKEGRASMKKEIIEIIRPLLARDCTLQKLVARIEEMD